MQVTAQNHFDLLLHKAVDGAPRSGHRDIEDTVVSGRELVVRDNDANLVFRHVGESLLAMLELMTVEPTVGDATSWCGGIEPDQHGVSDVEHRIQVGRDDFAVKLVRPEQTFEDAPKRHIMVTRNNEHGVIRHAVEEPPGFFELMTLGPLGEVTADNDGIGGQRRNSLQEGFRDRRHEWRPEVKIGYVDDFGRH
jgi:hypothetical protein